MIKDIINKIAYTFFCGFDKIFMKLQLFINFCLQAYESLSILYKKFDTDKVT